MRGVSRLDALAASIVLVGACSTFGSNPSAGDPDAGPTSGPDASPVEDAAPPPPAAPEAGVRCDPTAPFTSIRRIEGVNSPALEAFPRISADERVLYFQRSSGDATAIFRASRAALAEPFDTPVPVEGLPADSRHPAVTADEREIAFVTVLPKPYSIWRARRATGTARFEGAERHPADHPDDSCLAPFFSPDGAELYFARFAGATHFDLQRVRLEADGGVGTPEALDTLNSSSYDSEPTLSPDLLSLYFYSERSAPGPGKGSIWVAHRDAPTAPFRDPVLVEELVVDGGYTSPGSVSADGCRLYFYSDKDKATTGTDLYVAERSPQ